MKLCLHEMESIMFTMESAVPEILNIRIQFNGIIFNNAFRLGIVDGRLIGPYILPNRTDGSQYIQFLRNDVPGLLENA